MENKNSKKISKKHKEATIKFGKLLNSTGIVSTILLATPASFISGISDGYTEKINSFLEGEEFVEEEKLVEELV